MPLCGGTKTVQRKLVLLYVDRETTSVAAMIAGHRC